MSIAWLLDDESGPAVLSILERVKTEGGCVPSLWRLETANALRKAIRRRRYSEPFARACFNDLMKLPIVVDDQTDAQAWQRTWELANQYDLTIYDAAYLELALRRKFPLATCDMELVRAARRARLEVLAP